MSRFERPRHAYDYDYSGGRSFWDTRTFIGIDDDDVHDDDAETDRYSRVTLGHPRRRSAAPASVIGYGDLEFRPWSTATTTETTARPLITYDWDAPDHHRDSPPSWSHRERVRIRPSRHRDATLPPHHHHHPHHHPSHYSQHARDAHPLHPHPLRPSLKPSHSAGLPDLERESLKQRLCLDRPRPGLSDTPYHHHHNHHHPRARSLSLSRLANGTTGSGGAFSSASSFEPDPRSDDDDDDPPSEGEDVWGLVPPRVPGAPPPPHQHRDQGHHHHRSEHRSEHRSHRNHHRQNSAGAVQGGRRRRSESWERVKSSSARKTVSPAVGGRATSKFRGVKPQYNQVHALIITWSFHDLRAEDYTAPPAADYVSLEQETARLRATLESYGYTVHEFLIPMHRSVESLKAKLKQFCRYAADDTLLMVYYHGHGAMDDDNELVFSSHDHPENAEWSKAAAAELYAALLSGDACTTHGRRDKYQELLKKYERYRPVSTLKWDAIRTPILSAPCDVLLVLDCCAAGGAGLRHLSWQPPAGAEGYTKHLFAACGFESSTSDDMTAALCEVLDEWVPPPVPPAQPVVVPVPVPGLGAAKSEVGAATTAAGMWVV
ncbi:hypothetical protein B0I37DRAFT_408943 [Chaetomium sp. MPI-CAGE-AT-0009]|nr:hypothetical protein B0I37DRAFT_408943 [Chaetomium sp. MPI-CAGE-AT-0009]